MEKPAGTGRVPVGHHGRDHSRHRRRVGVQVEVYTYGWVIAHILTYAAHRRILAAGAINDAGQTGLDEDPVQWISATA